jgi:glycosyltransferase involved in cell wall biosynthesis
MADQFDNGAPAPRSARTGPLVSVIIPCHDRVDVLVECLASVASQTHRAIEVIVVDDASTDDIAQALAAVAWPATFTVELLRSDANVGPGAARELGRLRARGDFLSYLDSDDIWADAFVERQVGALVAHPEAGFSYCITRWFEHLPIEGTEPVRELSDRAHSSLIPLALDRRPWSTSSSMWTRAASDVIGPWSPLWNWEDKEYDCRAGCLGVGVTFLDAHLCSMRRSVGSISNESSPRMRAGMADAIALMDEVIERTGRRDDPVVADRIDALLYGSSLATLLDADLVSADRAMQRLRIRSRPLRVRLAAGLLRIARRLIGPANAARLGARLKPFVVADRR